MEEINSCSGVEWTESLISSASGGAAVHTVTVRRLLEVPVFVVTQTSWQGWNQNNLQ